ncbi:MAG: quinol:cytochrome C oxidoreductase [Chitinophagales bacterium]|nr:quinol:cytochrome C oxidoreductase [Chitinophagales bacterium]
MNLELNLDEKFIFPARLKTISFALIIAGLIGMITGYLMYQGDDNGKRFWANLLLDAIFFQGLTMGCAFFQAAIYVAYGGWSVALKRVPEAAGMFLPFSAVILLLVLATGCSHLYEWTDPNVVAHDPIIAGKTGYLNLPFFFIRFFFFVGILTALMFLMRKNSLKEDIDGGLTHYRNNLKWASVFLVFFAVYILVTAWDWIMSLDVHWYSTMYGWYSFSSFWVTAIAVITLIVVYLKRKGYLSIVNENHLHDLGKLMFAFSIFWTYLIFDQFMLIWYANIPEETEYFRQRYDHVMGLFYTNFILNFCAPFLILMSRDAKRKMTWLIIASWIIIIGHFLDFYLMVMPSSLGDKAGIGIMELLAPLFFAGLFIYVVFTNLSRAPLVARHHPFLGESLHHTT